MEEVIARFPHLAEDIFNSLSNKTLADCREVNKAWKGFIDSERFYKKFYKKRIQDEKRRRHSESFQNLQKLLPHHQGEKLSKAMILQLTAEYIYQLEQEKTRLESQNSQLKRLYRESQQGSSSPSLENSGGQNGPSNNTMSPRLKRKKIISNSSNPGGSDPGGSNPGGSNPGGSNPGGSNPRGSNPGGSSPVGSNPGSSNPGGTNPNRNNSNQNLITEAASSVSELSLLDQLMNEQRLRISLEERIKTLEKQAVSVTSNKDPKIL